MTARAIAKYVRVTPRKARLVADMVRGKSANEASSILRFTPTKGAKVVAKVIKSAVSNATSVGKVSADRLFISEVRVDPGPIIKRFQSRAHGRATQLYRRTSHIRVVLGER